MGPNQTITMIPTGATSDCHTHPKLNGGVVWPNRRTEYTPVHLTIQVHDDVDHLKSEEESNTEQGPLTLTLCIQA